MRKYINILENAIPNIDTLKHKCSINKIIISPERINKGGDLASYCNDVPHCLIYRVWPIFLALQIILCCPLVEFGILFIQSLISIFCVFNSM